MGDSRVCRSTYKNNVRSECSAFCRLCAQGDNRTTHIPGRFRLPLSSDISRWFSANPAFFQINALAVIGILGFWGYAGTVIGESGSSVVYEAFVKAACVQSCTQERIDAKLTAPTAKIPYENSSTSLVVENRTKFLPHFSCLPNNIQEGSA